MVHLEMWNKWRFHYGDFLVSVRDIYRNNKAIFDEMPMKF